MRVWTATCEVDPSFESRQYLAWFDVAYWVGTEWRVFLSEGLERLDDLTIGHTLVVSLGPGDHASKASPLTKPTVRNVHRWLVVSYENPTQPRSFLKVHLIPGSLWKHLDRPDHIPAALP